MYKQKTFYFVIIFIVVLISINFWSFVLLPKELCSFLEFLITILLVFIYIVNSMKISKLRLPFWNNIKFVLFVPFILGSVGAFIYHNQELYYSFWRQRTNFLWLLYPILHCYKIEPYKIIKLMLFVGAVWCVLIIVQQFTYPMYFFASRTEDTNSKEELLRAGVYRYMPYTWYYGMFLGFYFLNDYFFYKKLKSLFFVLLALISFYYFGTRQYAIGFVVCIIIYIFRQRGAKLALGFLFISIIGVILYFNFDSVFGKFIEMTNSQVVENDDYIRFKAFNFFLFDYWNNWTAPFIGNGLPYIASKYGREVEYIKNYYGYYASDIGIIGSLSNFGVFYIISVFALIYKMLVAKIEFIKNKYLKLIAVNIVVLIFLTETFQDPHAIPFWCLFLYLMDKASEKKYKYAKYQI